MSQDPPPPLPVLTNHQQQQLETYLTELLSANDKFNLTAIVDVEQARERHVVESLRLLPAIESILPLGNLDSGQGQHRTVLDLGSGGGLPGIVLAIARPDLNFVLLEATLKKARFLEDTSRRLKLKNVRVEPSRAELASAPGTKLRESFDIVTARAVAALPTLLELAVPFLKVGGTLLAIKGEKAELELNAAQNAMAVLHTECIQSRRHPSATLLLLKKLNKTPAIYPRRSGEPKKRPL